MDETKKGFIQLHLSVLLAGSASSRSMPAIVMAS